MFKCYMRMTDLYPLFIGGPEMVIILAVLALILGGERVAQLAKSSGKAIGEFKQEQQKIQNEVDDVKQQVEEDVEDMQDEMNTVANEAEATINPTAEDGMNRGNSSNESN